MDEIVHDRAAILAVGDEIVLGQSLDTNSPWVAARLIERGIRVVEHATVADDLERLTATILRLSTLCPLLIITAAPAPTTDPLTRPPTARALAAPHAPATHAPSSLPPRPPGP